MVASIELPAGFTSIGDGAFFDCSSLASIELPAGLTSIGGRAFDGCSSLASIELPAGLTRIGENTFDGCLSLASIELPAGLTRISDGTFPPSCTVFRAPPTPTVSERLVGAMRAAATGVAEALRGTWAMLGNRKRDEDDSLESI